MTRPALRTRARFLVVLTGVLALLAAPPAFAHEVRPAYLELTERGDGRCEVVWKVPVLGDGPPIAGEEIPHAADPVMTPPPGAPQSFPCGCPTPWASGRMLAVLPIHPTLPPGAKVVGAVRFQRVVGAEIRRFEIALGPAGLEGWKAEIHGLPGTDVDVIVRVGLADGRALTHVLRPSAPSFVFHSADAGSAASGYFLLGVEHILLGFDHLLFVLCLLLLVSGWRRVVATVTAFTLAHSVTLTLATLGVLGLPSAPVEATVALSIVFLAAEITSRRAGFPSLTERKPWLVAFAFGLLHGLGFAGALAEVGLPPRDVPLALALFNLGVEAGQLAFVALVYTVVGAAGPLAARLPAWWRRVPAYAIGTVAVFWLVIRVESFG